jgi:hypothetical protein
VNRSEDILKSEHEEISIEPDDKGGNNEKMSSCKGEKKFFGEPI